MAGLTLEGSTQHDPDLGDVDSLRGLAEEEFPKTDEPRQVAEPDLSLSCA